MSERSMLRPAPKRLRFQKKAATALRLVTTADDDEKTRWLAVQKIAHLEALRQRSMSRIATREPLAAMPAPVPVKAGECPMCGQLAAYCDCHA